MEDATVATGWAEVDRLVAVLRAQHGDRVVMTITEPRDHGYRAASEVPVRKVTVVLPVVRAHTPLVLVALAMPLAALGVAAFPPLLIGLAVIAVRLVSTGVATSDAHLVVEGDEVRVPRTLGREWRARVGDAGFVCKWSERTKMLVLASSRSGAITLDVAADTALAESVPELIAAMARAMDERNHEAA